ncbi:glycosyltransferase [Halobacteriovorax sp. HLS]|uniref:glycosyltransferase n=1 Tax=Halobacteriovorax sp. HLS TaxID=2234000 RepID=UPI000FD8B591|nr:glycosyltransferase [Halobacteriovorax sp. HLS]
MISIIIPCYDSFHLKKITRHFEDENEIEVIIVNDNPTRSISGINASNFRIINNQENYGPSKSRNIGLQSANGSIYIFLDSDVYLSLNQVQYIKEYFEKRNEISFLTSYLDQNIGENIYSHFKNIYICYQFSKHLGQVDFLYGSMTATNSKIYWPENKRIVEDNYFGLQLSRANIPIFLSPELQMKHLKEYTLKSIFLYDLKISFHMAELILLKTKEKIGDLNKVTHSNRAHLLALIFLLITISAWTISYKISLISFLCWLTSNISFFEFIKKNKKFSMLKYIPVMTITQLAQMFGAGLGLIYYSTYKKTSLEEII